MRVQEIYTQPDVKEWGIRRRLKREARLLDMVTRGLHQGATVLEVGSGRGEFAAQVVERGYRYIGIEPSSRLRERLVEKGFDVLADPVPPICLENESVDLVHSTALLEHLVSFPSVVEYFREAKRVLKRGGVLSSVVPNCDTLGMIFYLQDYQHSFVTNRGRLEHLARDVGLEVTTSVSFLTNFGLSWARPMDRLIAHGVLFVMRSPMVVSATRALTGDEFSYRIYKNLFDQIVFLCRKP